MPQPWKRLSFFKRLMLSLQAFPFSEPSAWRLVFPPYSLGLSTDLPSPGVILVVRLATLPSHSLHPRFPHNSLHNIYIVSRAISIFFLSSQSEGKFYKGRILKWMGHICRNINGQANYFETFLWMGACRNFFLLTPRQRA